MTRLRANAISIVVLLLLPLLILPQAHPAAPRALATFSGSIEPTVPSTSFAWDLRQDLPSFLFHYEITGGTDAFDVIDVSIDETGDLWQLLMGEGWIYCSGVGATDCPIDAGSYTVTVFSDPRATGRIDFRLGFSLVPKPPVDFAGFMPANADLQTRISSFGITFPNSTATYTAVLGVTPPGSYELFIDGESEGVVTETTTLPLDLEPGFHFFEVDATGTVEDVRWTVQVQGPPKLEVSIVDPCPVLNPDSGQSTCVTGAEAIASGGSPTVDYLWTTNGGTLNSTSGRWVEFTAPPGVASYSLTVNASAPGYLSDSTFQVVSVVPEFPGFIAPLLLMLICTLVVLVQKRFRPPKM